MSQREDLTEQSPLFRNTPRGRLSAGQTALGGRGAHCKRATAPGADAWMRLSRWQVSRAGDEKSGATPQGWVKGLRLKNGAQ